MSYGIIRVAKYKKGDVKGLQIHDQREKDKSHTNKDIDFSHTHLNYDLHNQININFTEKVNQRIKSLNLKKAVRKDAINMCQCLVTSDSDFFESLTEERQKQFFEDSYNFVSERYGKENIISAIVHYDERTPHLHINFVPVTSDGRLSAKDLISKRELTVLHDDFYKHNKSKGYDLKRGENKEEYQKHLTTEEFKIKKKQELILSEEERLKKAEKNIKSGEKTLRMQYNQISKKLKVYSDILDEYDDLKMPQVEDIFLQKDKVKIDKKDFIKLKALANVGVLLIDNANENVELRKLNSDLTEERDKLKEQSKESIIKKMQEKQNQNLKNLKLENKISELECFFDDVSEYLNKNNLVADFNNFIKDLKTQRELENKKNNEWDLEM